MIGIRQNSAKSGVFGYKPVVDAVEVGTIVFVTVVEAETISGVGDVLALLAVAVVDDALKSLVVADVVVVADDVLAPSAVAPLEIVVVVAVVIVVVAVVVIAVVVSAEGCKTVFVPVDVWLAVPVDIWLAADCKLFVIGC